MGGELKKGIVLNYVNLALSSLIPFFYTPIMLELLGQEEYALYKLSGSITGYLSLISLGLGSAITRYLIKARIEEGVEEERKVLGLFVMIFRIVAALALLVGVIMAFGVGYWYDHSLTPDQLSTMKTLIALLAINTAVNFIAAPYISIVNAHEKFIFLQTMSIFATCAGPILNLIALYMGYASIGLAVSSLVVTILFRVIYYLFVSRKLNIRPIFAKPSIPLVKDILTFSFWVFVSNIVSHLYGTTDTVLMGAIPELAIGGVAVYAVGELFTAMSNSFNAGISSLLAPRANSMVFNGADSIRITAEAIKMGRIQAYIISLIVSGFIAFGQPFIYFYLGEAYAKSYFVAILVMIPNIVPLVQSFCLNVLMARNKNKFRALLYLGLAIFNAVGTWFILPICGVIGAAFMTGLSFFIGHGLVMNWYYHVILEINMLCFWKQVGQIILFSAIMAIGVISLSSVIDFYNIWVLPLGIIVYTIVYVAICYYVIMNDSERSLIKMPAKMIINKFRNIC